MRHKELSMDVGLCVDQQEKVPNPLTDFFSNLRVRLTRCDPPNNLENTQPNSKTTDKLRTFPRLVDAGKTTDKVDMIGIVAAILRVKDNNILIFPKLHTGIDCNARWPKFKFSLLEVNLSLSSTVYCMAVNDVRINETILK